MLDTNMVCKLLYIKIKGEKYVWTFKMAQHSGKKRKN